MADQNHEYPDEKEHKNVVIEKVEYPGDFFAENRRIRRVLEFIPVFPDCFA